MESDISRRRALATIGAGAAATATGTAALAVSPDHPDAALLALERELREADEAEGIAALAVDRAESALSNPPTSHPVIAVKVGSFWGCTSEDQIRWACDNQDFSQAECDQLVAQYHEEEAARKAEREPLGLAPLDDALKVAGDRWKNVRRQIATTPANSVEGAAVKFRLVMEGLENGSTGWEEISGHMALETLERLVRGAGS